MASLLFPDTGTRLVVLPSGRPAVGAVGYLYADAALTVTAEVYADVNGTKGALLPLDTAGRRSITLDAHGEQVNYWGPADGTDRLWIVINGVASQVDADYNARIDSVTARVAAVEAGGSNDALLLHRAGAETVTGVKTHTVSPIVPTPTTSTQAAPKGYVDSTVAAEAADRAEADDVVAAAAAADATSKASTAAGNAQTAAVAAAATDATNKANAAQAAAVQRGNHTGTQSADTLTDGTTAKAFLATERTKLTGIASGATANSTDAQLRDRSTHSGTQAHTTITGLGDSATRNVGNTAGTVAAGDTVELTANKDQPSGYPSLDSNSKIPAAQMRPFVDRGPVAASTAYNVWDLVVYQGRRILITTAVTSSSSKFISAANYTPIGPATWVNVKDYGAKGDAVTDDTAAIQAAIDAVATTNSTFAGGTVFLPAGMYVTSATLVLKKHVWLRGEGFITTSIKLLANSNCHVVQNAIAASSSGQNADGVGLVDIQLDGNKANQNGAGPYYGLYLATNPTTTAASGDHFFDMHHTVQNVRVYQTKGDGFRFVGRSAIQVVRAFAYNCDGYGFFPTFDTTLSHCESDLAGKAGFYINNGSIRISACKSFKSGAADLVGAGFEFGTNANGVTLAACETQNNYGQGYYLNGASRCNIHGIADSNNLDTANAYPAVELLNSSNNIIDVVCWQGTQAGVQYGYQRNALRVTGTSTANSITVSHTALAPATVSAALTGDTVLTNSSVTVNGVSVTRTLATDTDVTITNPLDGQALTYDGATSKWRNSSAASASFAGGLFGDGSDGSATLDGTATVLWASKSGSTYTMNKDAWLTALTIDVGVILKPAGHRIFCTGTVTNNGTIDASGNAGLANGTAGATTGNGTLAGGVAGGAGNTGAGTAANNGSAAVLGVGNGGAGGAGASGAGAAGSFAGNANTWMLRAPQSLATGTIGYNGLPKQLSGGTGGGGGGGDGTNKGGGGGSGGGPVGVIARLFVNAGAITSPGGAGGTPTTGNAGGGGGGSGGLVLIFTTSAWTNSGTTTVTGGAAGAGVGTGSTGVAGSNGNVLNIVLS